MLKQNFTFFLGKINQGFGPKISGKCMVVYLATGVGSRDP
jgi:hypothetical protein